MPKQFLKNCLSFTRKDRTGITVLLSLILFFSAIPFLYPLVFKAETSRGESFDTEIALLRSKNKSQTKKQYADIEEAVDSQNDELQPSFRQSSKSNSVLFYFDPNTATATDLEKLGLSMRNIRTIQNFISKGGRFYHAEDIGKIWGLKEADIQRLMPYVQIHDNREKRINFKKESDSGFYHKKSAIPAMLDINMADSIAFMSLPGIGPKLSQRIITFREKLGGFYNTRQIAETYGLPDSVFQKISSRLFVNNRPVKLININTASVEEMKVHPYIRYAIANAIVQYRMQHGNYNSLEELKKIMLVTNEVFDKVVPYLKLN